MLSVKKSTVRDFEALAEQHSRDLWTNRLHTLANHLGVTPESLRRLGIGWNGRGFTFPMRDGAGRVIGIRTRHPSGSKVCVKGSRLGLFVPTGLHARLGHLLVCEGLSDTAAVLDLGFDAIGRPSCSAGTRLVRDFISKHQPEQVAIFADRDPDGQGERGADALASALVAYVPLVKVIISPAGVRDAREWVNAGATAQDINRAIGAAPTRRLSVGVGLPLRHKASKL